MIEVEALGAAEERPSRGLRSRGRITASLRLIVPGAALLAFGLMLGLGLLARSESAATSGRPSRAKGCWRAYPPASSKAAVPSPHLRSVVRCTTNPCAAIDASR